jgi:sialic acid synthase SpsE
VNSFNFGRSKVTDKGPCYVIAEIGHNHQGDLETALEMIKTAANCGVQAVKFQKRNNKVLFTKEYYNRLYDNENSY